MNLSKLESLDKAGLDAALGSVSSLVSLGLMDQRVLTKVRACAVRLQRRLNEPSAESFTWIPDKDIETSAIPRPLERSRLGIGHQYSFDPHMRAALVSMFGGLRPAPDCTILQIECYPGTNKLQSVIMRSNFPDGWHGKHLLRRFRVKDWTALWRLRDKCEHDAAERAELAALRAKRKEEQLKKPREEVDRLVLKGRTLREALVKVGISFKEYNPPKRVKHSTTKSCKPDSTESRKAKALELTVMELLS